MERFFIFLFNCCNHFRGSHTFYSTSGIRFGLASFHVIFKTHISKREGGVILTFF